MTYNTKNYTEQGERKRYRRYIGIKDEATVVGSLLLKTNLKALLLQ